MFHFRKFLTEKFQTPRGVTAFLTSYGAETPNEGAVEKWFQRGAIPSSWFAVLLAYLELDQGKAPTLVPYLERGGKK